ncbi:DUF1302 domain-containing protein [Pseudoduganella namucuonensis]|uniref:DUF1302 family protein n=1 Tax=Pseudoduganella namucuonensis TaxID=1035707 RepID=A0A1I7LZA9_9BURK|nr:DUF1302 domain-containing protein [Pseudoduganella namucuonensis]SFV14996.1 Protein of unknown function [Pseudoduganella namucuonensis]
MTTKMKAAALAAALLCASAAQGIEIKGETVSGNFDSTVSAGVGMRAGGPACGSVIGSFAGSATPAQPGGPGAPAGCADVFSSYNDQGNLNYARHDRFTTYLKGTHELLLNFPGDVKFLGRVSWLRDFAATDTTGIQSGSGGPAPFPPGARDDLRQKVRLLDFWVSKSFTVGEERVRVRAGNQVVNWGESLFLPGGMNQTNAVDLMRLAQPGTQLKEAVLPAPMVNVSTGLGNGLSIEAYAQQGWNGNYFPPVGSYWSIATVGKGADVADVPNAGEPRNGGQYGAALRYQPEGTSLNLGFYAINYHDKSPVVETSLASASGYAYRYLEDRKLLGVSANFPLGNWAIGTELSYRPRDPIALNGSAPGLAENSLTPVFGVRACLANGACHVEQKKFQLHVTGLLSLTPGDHGAILNLLGASTGTLLAEAVAIRYPDLQGRYQGVPVAAGGWGWGYESTAAADATGPGVPGAVGTRGSYGYNFDFSWVYDGTLIPGWQVVPEVYFFHAVKGRTPNMTATFMQGAKSANFIVGFIKNPASWQVSVNYARFWGGSTVFDQPLRDRGFFGATLSRNF